MQLSAKINQLQCIRNVKLANAHRFSNSDHQCQRHPKRSLEKPKQWGAILTHALGVASRLVIEGGGDVLNRTVQSGVLTIVGMQ